MLLKEKWEKGSDGFFDRQKPALLPNGAKNGSKPFFNEKF